MRRRKGLNCAWSRAALSIHSDPRLLEQMIRNLLSNALKYTKRGKVLLGCRRRGGMLSIEIWDTGIGIPDGELQAIFEEYHQLDNAARERSRGLGLGLSIVNAWAICWAIGCASAPIRARARSSPSRWNFRKPGKETLRKPRQGRPRQERE